MAIWEWKIQESCSCSVPRGWVSQLPFCICWSPKEVGSSSSEGMDVLTRQEQTGEKQPMPLFFHCPYTGFQQKVWPRLKVCLPASRSRSKFCVFQYQNPDHKCGLYFWVAGHSRYTQINNREQPSHKLNWTVLTEREEKRIWTEQTREVEERPEDDGNSKAQKTGSWLWHWIYISHLQKYENISFYL